MSKKFYIFVAILVLFASCNSKKTNENTQNESQAQSELMQSYNKADSLYHQNIIDNALFEDFIKRSIDFAGNYPDAEMAPDMLWKAGVGCMILAKKASWEEFPDQEYINKYAQLGLDLFTNIQGTYPDFKDVKMCYINRAIIYDDILHKYLDAEYEYRDFLHKYPDDSLCDNIREYLPYLGKSEEEIFAHIENQQKEK